MQDTPNLDYIVGERKEDSAEMRLNSLFLAPFEKRHYGAAYGDVFSGRYVAPCRY